MTREDIMKLDERGLYIKLQSFVGGKFNTYPPPVTSALQDNITLGFMAFLHLCYQAEEKLCSMGLDYQYGLWLEHILGDREDLCTFSIAHAHPKQRAQSILLTIEKNISNEIKKKGDEK